MRARIVLTAIISAVLLQVPCAFSQQTGKNPNALARLQEEAKQDGFMVGVAVPSANKSQAIKVKKVDVYKLSKELEKLIKKVENSSLACETRNSVVRRVRKLDDALLSGQLSGARALATAWRQHAWSLQAARLIDPELGSSLQTELGGMTGKIGLGRSDKPGKTKRWKPLPICDSGRTSVSVSGLAAATAGDSSYEPFDSEDVLDGWKTDCANKRLDSDPCKTTTALVGAFPGRQGRRNRQRNTRAVVERNNGRQERK